jgi:3-oxoacyl-[acyl-carrier protein] reductase
MRLNGKIAIVTGAGGGFGEGIAHRFANEGAKVAVVDLRGDAAERVAREIGENAFALTADVGDGAAVDRVVCDTAADRVAADYGQLGSIAVRFAT